MHEVGPFPINYVAFEASYILSYFYSVPYGIGQWITKDVDYTCFVDSIYNLLVLQIFINFNTYIS